MNPEGRKRLEEQMLSDADVDLLYDILAVTDYLLTHACIDYTISAGTLLGQQRCRGLIPHANSVDLLVLEDDLQRVRGLRTSFIMYDLEIREAPGYGIQISWKHSPELPGMRWESETSEEVWVSRRPFLEIIPITFTTFWETPRYVASGVLHRSLHPQGYLEQVDWEQEKDRVHFGHLMVKAIAPLKARLAYLDRYFPDWSRTIEMTRDYKSMERFKSPIRCTITHTDLFFRGRSLAPIRLPWM